MTIQEMVENLKQRIESNPEFQKVRAYWEKRQAESEE